MSRLFRISLMLAIFFGAEKILGFVRQLLIARQFGLSPELDAFNAANNIPELIFILISGGALAMALIPVLSEHLQKGSRQVMWDLFSRVANLVFLLTALLSIGIALLAEPLVGWELGIAPGFDEPQKELVADLMRLNLIATLLLSLSGLVIAGLQANQHFLLPAIAPSMYDFGTLFGVLILAPESGYQIGPLTLPAFGMGVHGLVYGVILGTALYLGILIPGLVRYQFRWVPVINLNHPGVKQVLVVMGPRVATVFFIQLTFLAQDNVASRLPTGAIVILVYGWLIMQVPETLIGTAIGTALLPTLSEQIARHEREKFFESLHQAIRAILGLALPGAALLAVVIRPLAEIFNFDAAGTELLVWTARAFLLGLAGHALLEVAARAFYAQQDARTPLLSAAMMAGVFIISAILLAPVLGVPGIALANSIAFTLQAMVLLYLLNRKSPGLLRIGGSFVRLTTVSAGAALLVYGLMHLPLPSIPLAIGAFTIGGLSAFPFLWPEMKVLVKLGGEGLSEQLPVIGDQLSGNELSGDQEKEGGEERD